MDLGNLNSKENIVEMDLGNLNSVKTLQMVLKKSLMGN